MITTEKQHLLSHWQRQRGTGIQGDGVGAWPQNANPLASGLNKRVPSNKQLHEKGASWCH